MIVCHSIVTYILYFLNLYFNLFPKKLKLALVIFNPLCHVYITYLSLQQSLPLHTCHFSDLLVYVPITPAISLFTYPLLQQSLCLRTCYASYLLVYLPVTPEISALAVCAPYLPNLPSLITHCVCASGGGNELKKKLFTLL